MEKCSSSKCECESVEEEDEVADHNRTAGYREKCYNMLRSISEEASTSCASDRACTHCGERTCVNAIYAALHRDLRRYGDAESELRCWMDMDTMKGRLAIEIESWSRAAVLSEEKARDLLVSWCAPELPRRLADRATTDSLQPADLDSVYARWRWAVARWCATCAEPVDSRSCYRVTMERANGGHPSRVRASWAMPLLVVAEETRYALPLLERFQRGDGAQRMYFRLERDQKCALQLQSNKKCFDELERCYNSQFQYVLINYKVFDSAVPNWVVRICFEVLSQKLDFGREQQADGTTVRKEPKEKTANRKRYEMMVKHLLRMPINVAGGGQLVGGIDEDEDDDEDADDEDEEYTILKRRGIPGGSCFTYLVRTMSNFLITWTVADLVFRDKVCSYRFHGRKCVLVFESRCETSLCAFSQCAQTYFGVRVDPNRSCITATIDDFHSLKYCCDTDEEDFEE